MEKTRLLLRPSLPYPVLELLMEFPGPTDQYNLPPSFPYRLKLFAFLSTCSLQDTYLIQLANDLQDPYPAPYTQGIKLIKNPC